MVFWINCGQEAITLINHQGCQIDIQCRAMFICTLKLNYKIMDKLKQNISNHVTKLEEIQMLLDIGPQEPLDVRFAYQCI